MKRKKNNSLNGGEGLLFKEKNEDFNPFEAFMYIPKPMPKRLRRDVARTSCKSVLSGIPFMKDSTKYNSKMKDKSETQTLVIALPCVEKGNNSKMKKGKNIAERGNVCPTVGLQQVQNVSPSIPMITREEENQIKEARVVSPYFQKKKAESVGREQVQSVGPMITGATVVSPYFQKQKAESVGREQVQSVSPMITGEEEENQIEAARIVSPYFQKQKVLDENKFKVLAR